MNAIILLLGKYAKEIIRVAHKDLYTRYVQHSIVCNSKEMETIYKDNRLKEIWQIHKYNSAIKIIILKAT